ncbi:MAG: low molecular weight protein arginine phosphatase [Opitutales bacterium]
MASERNWITFVCTANTCRSPMAAALFKHALLAQKEPLCSIEVESAGVSALTGEPVSNNAARALEEVGLDISDHRSYQLTYQLLRRSFAVFCMTESHRVLIEMSFDNPPKHLYLMRELIPNTQELTIPDPFGLNINAYRACRDSMVEAIPPIINFLKKHYPQ